MTALEHAKRFVQKNAARTALVIVPLAMASSASASTIFYDAGAADATAQALGSGTVSPSGSLSTGFSALPDGGVRFTGNYTLDVTRNSGSGFATGFVELTLSSGTVAGVLDVDNIAAHYDYVVSWGTNDPFSNVSSSVNFIVNGNTASSSGPLATVNGVVISGNPLLGGWDPLDLDPLSSWSVVLRTDFRVLPSVSGGQITLSIPAHSIDITPGVVTDAGERAETVLIVAVCRRRRRATRPASTTVPAIAQLMGRDGPRLLLVLPQLPQDPASGAARSMTSICELLAASGWRVRALCTTLSEAKNPTDALAVLNGLGVEVKRRVRRGSELHYSRRDVAFRALPVAQHLRLHDWEKVHGRSFNLAFAEELDAFRPDVMFTYGMYPSDLRRQRTAIRVGTKVVFGLRNEAYLGFRDWDHVSGVLTPTRYLADLYRADCSLESTPLLAPLDPDEILAADHEPIFITLVNPSIRKGVDFFAHFAERLSVNRPDLPFLVIESEGSAGTLVAAGQRAGFDLRRHENIMISRAVPQPKDIFAPTRVLVVPSLQEPGARVVAEALLNGVPPLVSDRGGLPEMCNGAGRVLPVDDEGSVDAWIEAILPLMDDENLYQLESRKAREAATAYDRDALRPK